MASSNGGGGGGGVPPGFRFHPTDEELLHYYLKKKITFQKFDMDVIREIDLNKIEPWDLQERCKIGSTPQNEWYFFSHKDRKYPTGSRTNRATNAGFWKATGRDKCIRNSYKKIGMRKTLVFYRGRAPHGQKTDWIMHEYRLEEADNLDPQGNPTSSEDGWVICRVFKKKNLFKLGNEGGGGANASSDQHLNNGSTAGHQSRTTFTTQRDNPYLHLQHPHGGSHGSSGGLTYSHIPLTAVSQYSQIQAQNFMPTSHKPLGYEIDHHHFSTIPSSDHQSPLMVKQLMTNNTRDCTESGGSDQNQQQLRYHDDSAMEVGTCHDHHQVSAGRDENNNINDWGMLMNSQIVQHDDDSSKGVRFDDANGSSMNQINQLSLRGEMDFWGYGK